MNIRLPTHFFYTTRDHKSCAYIEHGILYIEGIVSFEDLMYALTYEIFGYNKCNYCKCTLTSKSRTLDHIYPRSWGGISITNNLRPSCRLCNGQKSDMTIKQFKEYMKQKSLTKKRDFYHRCIKENESKLYSQDFLLPPSWICLYDASKLAHTISFKSLDRGKVQKIEDFYNKYHHYPRPLIISANGWLLKGKHILYHAKQIDFFDIPAIVLDNVVVIPDK